MDSDLIQDQPLNLVITTNVTEVSCGYLQTAVVEDIGLTSTSYWLEQPFETAIDALWMIRRQRCMVANKVLEQSP